MHPLEALNEAQLGHLTRVAERLINSRHLLAPGNRPDRLRSGFGIEFLDHRDFTPGDDLRDIDWRTTARSRNPQIRRYCNEASADWFVILDCSASMVIGDAKKWSLAVQCAAAIAYLLLQLDNRVSILIFSDKIDQMVPLGRGYTHYASILQTLRQIKPASSGGASNSHTSNSYTSNLHSCVSRIKRNSPVFVISDFLTADNMRDALNALSLRSDRLHALQILSEQDTFIPSQTTARFKDVETGQTMAVKLTDTVRKHYHTALHSFQKNLSRLCRKQHIHFSTHMDNEHWKSVLVAHLQARSRQ